MNKNTKITRLLSLYNVHDMAKSKNLSVIVPVFRDDVVYIQKKGTCAAIELSVAGHNYNDIDRVFVLGIAGGFLYSARKENSELEPRFQRVPKTLHLIPMTNDTPSLYNRLSYLIDHILEIIERDYRSQPCEEERQKLEELLKGEILDDGREQENDELYGRKYYDSDFGFDRPNPKYGE